MSGRRYGELSGPVANVCVGAEGLVDEDHDGVDDNDDNCLGLANASQHDEDMDQRGDACDPCPAFADGPTPDDADDDGVSGQCDPEPTEANRIVEFNAFDAGAPAGWTTQGGTWTYANGFATVDSEGGGTGMLLKAAPGANVSIMTALTIDSLDAGGTRVAGVVDLFDIAGDQGTSCVAIRLVTGTQQMLLSDTLTSASYGSMPFTVQAGTEATVISTRVGPDITCSIPPLSVTGTPLFVPSAPQLGLRTRGAKVRFAWLLVVGR